MRNALRVLVAVACLAFPVAAEAGNYYYPPTPYSYQPAPVPQLFYAPPIVRTTMVGSYGYGHGGYGGCCAHQVPNCCYRPQPTCCGTYGGGYGYGGYAGGYGYSGGYVSAGVNFGYGHHHHYRPPHHHPRPPHYHPRPPRHSQSAPAAQPQYAAHYSYQPHYAQAYYAQQPYYYAQPQYAPQRIAAAPRPKPIGLRGVSKPLPPVRTASTKAKDTAQVASAPEAAKPQEK